MTLVPELRADLRAAAMRPDRGLAHFWTKLRRPKLFVATGALTIAGAIVAVVLVLSASSATSPAYAVTTHPDGSVTITLRDVATGIPAVSAKLHKLGYDVAV